MLLHSVDVDVDVEAEVWTGQHLLGTAWQVHVLAEAAGCTAAKGTGRNGCAKEGVCGDKLRVPILFVMMYLWSRCKIPRPPPSAT